ncbi:PilZ domain-containing protein [Methylomonas sp. SURF-1]|uniref:PilZ domain-containing protein n=1 Tax=Methylomonas aurea TaxID=2952224 RepID=A0ABT1UHH4_9GAMM|nr:PilZ domain-containing protein [Methylomonas sp. SURF-1]MCQ8181681.1 PilZ domain-containing protein [Methylomonas sp. SURF-1]
MSSNATDNNNYNRRLALRIYEQINLFYQILPYGDSSATSGSGDSRLSGRQLPASNSIENDTLQANISANGMSFTCKERLQSGDYLQLRILLLSSMTTVSTCGQVVYCKPSNPYEDGRYPHTVGVRFVNLSETDAELLRRHVERRKRQSLAITVLAAALILGALAMPDLAWAVLIGLLHHIWEIALHLAHLLFEYLEMGLDHVVEHLFHTGTHETQVIVFYTIVVIGAVALYLLGRKLPGVVKRWYNALGLFASRKKSSCLYFWDQQSGLDKLKIVGISASALTVYLYLSF